MSENINFLKEKAVSLYYKLLNDGVKYGIYSKIAKLITHEERICVHRSFVQRTIRTFLSTGSTCRRKGPGRPNRKSSNQNILRVIDECMKSDDEYTAKEIQTVLSDKGYNLSISLINKLRQKLGWTIRNTRYCQLVRENNKPKRLQWAKDNINDEFNDVIWTDETSVSMEQYRRRCYRKRGVQSKRKPVPKHPLKVHVWAGISRRGKTHACIFNGIMTATLYVDILKKTLVPFIRENYPRTHRFMQDNDPKHTSRHAKEFFQEENINWWKTPAESPDMNPIENLWHEMKDYIRKNVKPRRENELINGILQFWETVTVAKCNSYINHLKKVMPEVIRLNGQATGY